MNYKMKLQNEPFNLIRDGHKTIEARVNDEKRKLLNIGDDIEFTNTKTSEKINVTVVDLMHYRTFDDLLKANNILEFGSSNKKNLLIELDGYYTKEKIKQYGVIGIKIKKIENSKENK